MQPQIIAGHTLEGERLVRQTYSWPLELLQILDVWCWGPWTNTSFKLISPGTHRFSGVHCESKTIHYLLSLLPVLGAAPSNGCFPSLKRINAYLIRSSRNFGRRESMHFRRRTAVAPLHPRCHPPVGLAFFSTITSLAR